MAATTDRRFVPVFVERLLCDDSYCQCRIRAGRWHISATEREKLQLQCIISEGKILKAYCYFNLLRLFAPDYGDGAEKDGIILKDQFKLGFLKRSSIEECVKAIRTMLTEATEVDNNPAEIYWFSQISGYYLWAMLELYSRNYDQAIIYAGKVMEAKEDMMCLENQSIVSFGE